ncbi:MAG: hypothetical protein WCR71_07160 [Bacteroidales bacterium]
MKKEMDDFKKMLYKSYLNNMIFYGKEPTLSYEEWLKEVEAKQLAKKGQKNETKRFI